MLTEKLTILFEDPFWIGLYERMEKGRYQVCKIVFGAEPADGEVYNFMLKNWNALRFSVPVITDEAVEKQLNPKRIQREVRRAVQNKGIGTKAQQALKQMQEMKKQKEKSMLSRIVKKKKSSSLFCGRRNEKKNTEGIEPSVFFYGIFFTAEVLKLRPGILF